MKFSCTQENLHQGLSVVSHIANKSINLPILGNVLIKSEDKILRLMTTNLEIAVSCVVRGKMENQGEFTVPSRLFSDYVALLPKERVDVSQDANSLEVACGTYRTKLNGINATEFPLIPKIERDRGFSLKVNDLRKAISQVLFAVAPNESRPEISGVLFRFTPKEGEINLILAATDSYRLAEKVVPVNKGKSADISEAVSVIVPSRTVSEVMRILSVFKDSVGGSDEIEIYLADNQVLFSYNNVEVVSRTIEGKYPDYRQLIPESFRTEVSVGKDDMLRAIKTTSLFTRTGLNDINLSFAPGEPVKVNSLNSQTGEHSADIDGEVKGKENSATVNYKYFLDGVNNIETDRVEVQMVDGMSPCLIRPNGGKLDYLYIVMPIRQ
jgi:DNA polymerase-3 subunit beta